ncbi:hypothetical protein EYF80_009737 [Liparis tanakae]|uniref:Uncharacterized protein n=1 Tax=Liparis tanakae TaxID=230148 RepID=A0A4Z2IQ96_9TELE|nr:hypothetical protein EYF80_009737 [Liparis tanakae]
MTAPVSRGPERLPQPQTICLSASIGITTNIYVDIEARPCRESGYAPHHHSTPQFKDGSVYHQIQCYRHM